MRILGIRLPLGANIAALLLLVFVLMALLAAASQVLAGNAAEAANWANSVRERDPSLTRADFQRGYPVTAEPMRTKIDTALRGLGF